MPLAARPPIRSRTVRPPRRMPRPRPLPATTSPPPDNSLSILQKTVNDPKAGKDAVDAASKSITAMASATLQESKIESLVTAKGYSDCVAFIGDNSVSVVVKAKNNDLKASDVAKITDIVVGETKFSAGDVKVISSSQQ